MKVAMIRVPTIVDESASTAPICPPIGLSYLKSIVNAFTKDIQVIDSVGNKPEFRTVESEGRYYHLLGQKSEEIVNLLLSDTDIILISVMFSQDWPYSKEVIRGIKKKCPKSLIVAGGEHITALPKYSLESAPEIDICVLGEGEKTLYNLLDYFKNNKTFPKNIPGTYSNLNQVTDLKNFQKTEKQIRIKKIDEIQWPDWEGFPLENYFKEGYGFGVNLGRSMPIIASRGCPYQCTFCSNPNMWTTLWKARDPKDVVEEMKFYLDKYQISNFDFYDLTAIVKKKWIVQFCNLLVENNLNITWQLPSGTRSEAIDRNVAKLLYKSGCRNLSYAPESGSNEILVLIKKKIKLEKMIKSMKDCVFEGLSVKVNIICGFPSEKWKHLIESLKFITQIAWVGCDDMSINQFSPYPGSELFEDLIRTNKVKLDEKYFIGLSYYSSMTNADSYSRYLSNQEILIFKFIGTSLFYAVNFMRRPWRLFLTLNHVYKGIETTRIEKTLNSYIRRSKVKNGI